MKTIHYPSLTPKINRSMALSLRLQRLLIFQIPSITIDYMGPERIYCVDYMPGTVLPSGIPNEQAMTVPSCSHTKGETDLGTCDCSVTGCVCTVKRAGAKKCSERQEKSCLFLSTWRRLLRASRRTRSISW